MNAAGWRSLLARGCLLAGVVAFVTVVGPRLPHEQEFAFNLGQAKAEQLEVSWTPEAEVEAQGGFSLNLASSPTRSVRHTAELPNGNYRLDIVVTRSTAASGEPPPASDPLQAPTASTTTYVRRVTLDGGRTTIHLP